MTPLAKTGTVFALALVGAGVLAFVLRSKTSQSAEPKKLGIPTGPNLDADLPQDEIEAVNVALALESNADNLRKFSDSLAPTFPIAAGVLNTKAQLMSGETL